MNIINNSQVLGSPSKDLVLNTLGKVYVRTGDRYYELDFRNTPVPSDIDVNTDSAIESNISESDVVITKSISDLEYPGDNKFVISLDGKFYITTKGRYKNVTPSNNSPENINNLTITSLTNVNVIGQLYSDGLIVDFLSNKITVDTLEVDKISAKSINVSNLNIASNDTFVSGSGKLYIGPELSIYDTDSENDLIYFYTRTEFDTALFPKRELITDNIESFVCEIVDVTSDYILGRLISGEVNEPSKIILKGDHIRYDSTGKSFYDKTYNLRFNHISDSGNYTDLELATVNSNVSVTLKSGTLLKCLSDCTIDVTVNEINNKYQLYKNVLYLINDTNCINLTDSIRYFKTKQEFDNVDRNTIDVAFIEDTEQIYYNGLLVGGEQKASLPNNFKIENATTGAIIVNKDGIWQPSYDYVTTQYVNDQVKDLIDNAPDALNTFNKIAIVVQNNANRIDEIYRLLGSNVSVEELNNKLDDINSKLDSIDVNNIIAVLDDKASGSYVKDLEDGLSSFATKAGVESALETYLKPTQNNTSSAEISSIQFSISKIQSKLTECTREIELLKTKNNKFDNSVQSLTSSYNSLVNRIEELENNSGNVNIDLSDYVTKTSFSEHAIEFSNHINAYNSHITSYNKHISDYNTHVANYTTGKDSVDKVMSVFEIDSAGDLRVKKGLYSDSFVTAGGKNGTSSSSVLTRFDGPGTSYTDAKATNVLSASLGKDLNDRLTYLENNGVGNSGSTSVTGGSITGKPTFATVATSGSYNDLSNKPSIPSLRGYATESGVSNNYQPKGNYLTSVSWSTVTGKPTFASVATSGSYNDLSNKPTIPTNLNQLANGPGYITGINSSMVTSALGYTPYNSANFTKSNIKSTLGISAGALASTKPSYKTSEIAEQTNLYFTNARAVAAMSNATITGNLTVTGIVTGQVDCVGGSDIRYKTIIENIDVTSKIFDEILNAPLFKFKGNNSDKIYIGTSAQYGANTELKDVVKYDSEKDFHYLSYQSLAFGIGKINSSIIKSHATKLSEQNKRIIKLEAQVEELQTKLIEHGIE